MISIPQELIDQFTRGNVLLFIGDRILRDGSGQVVLDQLTAELAGRVGLDAGEDHTFAEAAQAYEDERGRQALVQLVRDRFAGLGSDPQPVHRLIASLDEVKVMIYTSPDALLERACADAGRPLDVIIGNVDVAFEDEHKTQLYKLHGSLERPESLVLTEDDYESFLEDQASISLVLQGYLARKTILFAGYDLSDPHFKRLLHKVTAPLDDYARRAYAFATTSTPSVARWCKRHGVELIEVTAESFLQELVQQLTSRARRAKTAATGDARAVAAQPLRSLPERPYKLLDYYDSQDADIFYGREREVLTLSSLIHAHRLVSLYGASGTGKTSLLLAGVAPGLENADPAYTTVYVRVRAGGEPGLAVRNALRRRLRTPRRAQGADGADEAVVGQTPVPDLPETGPLVEFLEAAVRAAGCRLVIFLDQFEEFFTEYGPETRQAFIRELGDVYDARDLPVKLVFSFREDWLASLNELRQRLPEVFNADMRLLPLRREQARQAITAPAEQVGLAYEPALVERLLDDLAAHGDSPSSDRAASSAAGARPEISRAVRPGLSEGGAVMPPQLQLVCDALYEQTRSGGRQRILVSDYEEVGGVQGVLAGYIEEALQKHPPEERGVARSILAALVTSGGARAWLDVPAIRAAGEADIATTERILARLVAQRLVRRVDGRAADGSRDAADAYELTHDVLAGAIGTWIDQEDRRLKQAQELLRRELADWRQDAAVLISQPKFERIDAVRDGLRLAAEETEFMLRAAVLHGQAVPYWLDRVSGPDAQVKILLEMLAHPLAAARVHAAAALAAYAREGVTGALVQAALADAESAVRDSAAVSLGRMTGPAGIKALADAAAAGDEQRRRRALHALALVQDMAPGQLRLAPQKVRWQARYALAGIRFWRHWPAVRATAAAGAAAGALGFGLGLGIPLVLHEVALSGGGQAVSLLFSYVPFLAALGVVAGAGVALGIGLGRALFAQQSLAGRLLLAALLGAVSFALVLSPFTLGDAAGARVLAGSLLFGLLVACGAVVPLALDAGRALVLLGGAGGGALGIALFGALGFKPFTFGPRGDVSPAVLLACGALLGLILAAGVEWALKRWPAGSVAGVPAGRNGDPREMDPARRAASAPPVEGARR